MIKMTAKGFELHLMLATDEDLRDGIADDTLSFDTHMRLVHALHTRETARLAADRLSASTVRWTEVSAKINYIVIDDVPTGELAR